MENYHNFTLGWNFFSELCIILIFFQFQFICNTSNNITQIIAKYTNIYLILGSKSNFLSSNEKTKRRHLVCSKWRNCTWDAAYNGGFLSWIRFNSVSFFPSFSVLLTLRWIHFKSSNVSDSMNFKVNTLVIQYCVYFKIHWIRHYSYFFKRLCFHEIFSCFFITKYFMCILPMSWNGS